MAGAGYRQRAVIVGAQPCRARRGRPAATCSRRAGKHLFRFSTIATPVATPAPMSPSGPDPQTRRLHCASRVVVVIYIALPMSRQPRILQLLDELRDTTVSIYFVAGFSS